MRSLFFFSLLSIICTLKAISQEMEVVLNNNVFYAPEIGPYVETNILIPGKTVSYVENDHGKLQGSIKVSLIFSKGEKVIAFDKYILKSVEITDTLNINLSLIDKKRFNLPNGVYSLDASFTDINHPDRTKSITQTVIVDFSDNQIQISDLSLIDSFEKDQEESIYTKSGLYLVPYVINYYPAEIDLLTFYAEVYNTDKVINGDQFLVLLSVKKDQTDQVMGNLSRYMKVSAQPVTVILSSFDITQLPSGNYELNLEVKDKGNNLLSLKKLFFYRSNDIEPLPVSDYSQVYTENSFVAGFSKEDMVYLVKSINPISTIAEAKTGKKLIKQDDAENMKKYFLNFWMSKSPSDPYSAWLAYSIEVKRVEDEYSSNLLYGFEIDRGRVYLQYGPPNQIIKSAWEPHAYPYEVWTYYSISNGQTNVKFIFYDPELLSNFYLIHSDANGEIKNEFWQRLVHGYDNSPLDKNTQIRDHFGTKASENYAE